MKQAQIRRLLPAVLQAAAQTGSPLSAILQMMEALHAPCEAALDGLDVSFSPYRAPDAFVPYLAGWVDLEVLLDVPHARSGSSTATLSTGLGRLRELVSAAVTLSKWRGTRKGLTLFLETATGAKGFQVDEKVSDNAGQVRPFHVRVTAPKELKDHRVLIERIIELEKPAYVTYQLEFQ